MRSTRLVAAAFSLLLTVGTLSGCGDDDSDAAPSDSANATEEQRGACEAEVEVTGAVKVSWTGEAFVVTENRSGPVLYKAEDGRTVLTLLGANGDFPPIASLSTKKGSFSGSDGTIEVDDQGSGATAEATLQAGGGKSVDVMAEFTCQ